MTTNPTPTQNLISSFIQEFIDGKHLTAPKTLKNPILISIYEAEMLVLQRVTSELQETDHPMNPEWLSGILMGCETILRRIEERGILLNDPSDQSDNA